MGKKRKQLNPPIYNGRTRRKSPKYQKVYPKKRKSKYQHLIDNPSLEATSKGEKNFIRRYSRRFRSKLKALQCEKCAQCGTDKRFLHIHHLKYTTNPGDWILLCNPCHRKLHGFN